MNGFSPALERLLTELSRLPGIGRKSAQRIGFYLLKADPERSEELARVILEARRSVRFCDQCRTLTTETTCEICRDDNRDRSLICVVEEPFNIIAIEKTRLYHGLYYVLHGNLSPVNGIGPDELHIPDLLRRVADGQVREVILATSPTTEGNATAHFISDQLRNRGLRVTRIALGLPVGADMDYVDALTIARSIEGRRDVD
ncbi:MAG: recombination mediator RecR [Acidobacteriota bacterium]|jgi:recombination protein RecR|nr:recombination mediator RecR [Acidobacteriota bacterium]